MAIIPRYEATQGLDTGRGTMPSVPAMDATARAMQGFGNAVANLGLHFQRQQEQFQGFEAQRRFLEWTGEQERELQDAKINMPVGGHGFYDQRKTYIEDKSAEFLASLPENLRPEFGVKIQRFQELYKNDAATTEVTAKHNHYKTEIGKGLNSFGQHILLNPDMLDDAKTQGYELIDKSGLPPQEKEALRRGWDETATMLYGQGLVRRDPERAARELGVTKPSSSVDYVNPTLRGTVLDASRATGVDPEYLAITLQKESGINVTGATIAKPAKRYFTDTNFTSKHYQPSELKSKDGAPLQVDVAAVVALDRLTDVFGRKLTITSGHRSAAHNTRVSGAKDSQHVHGTAFDIDMSGMSTEDRRKLLNAAIDAGFSGIGFYARSPNMLHLDVRGKPATWYHGGSGRFPAWAADIMEARHGATKNVEVSRTSIKNPNSSATGAAQFLDDTWTNAQGTGVFDKYASKYGINTQGMSRQQKLEMRNDTRISIFMAAEYARENADVLRPVLGREPTPGELYIAHFFGPGNAQKGTGAAGFLKAMQENPSGSAAQLFAAEARANPNIFYKRGAGGARTNPRTVEEVYGVLTSRFSGGSPGLSGEMASSQTPVVSRVNERFASIDPTKLRALQSLADQGIEDRARVLQRQQEIIAQQQESEYKARVTEAERRIYEDRTYSKTNLLEQAFRDSDYVRLAKQIDERDKELNLVGEAMHRYQTNQPFSPYDSADRQAVQRIYEGFDPGGQKLAQGDQTAIDAAAEITTRTGIMPKQVAQSLAAKAMSSDPAVAAQGLSALQRIVARAPQAMQGVDGMTEVEKDLSQFRYYVEDLGFSPNEAAKTITDRRAPENKARYTVNQKEADKFAKDNLTEGQLESAFQTGWTPLSQPHIGLNETQKNVILEHYRDLGAHYYIELGGDKGAARRAALDHMKRLYGVSNLSGRSTIMQYPPEKFYPAVGEDHSYIMNQAIQHITEAGFKDITPSNVTIKPYPQTAEDVRRNQPPRYLIEFVHERNGVPHLEWLPMAFRPDITQARTAQQELNQQRFLQMQDEAQSQRMTGTMDAEIGQPFQTERMRQQLEQVRGVRRPNQAPPDDVDLSMGVP